MSKVYNINNRSTSNHAKKTMIIRCTVMTVIGIVIALVVTVVVVMTIQQ